MNKRTVEKLEVRGKRVLVRADLNVPLNEDGEITDDARIRATLPTIEYLLREEASVILMSHFGRPKGKFVESLSLRPVAEHLSKLLSCPVKILPDCVGTEVEQQLSGLKSGEVALLENLRFHPGEEKNDPAFSAALASLADCYVNDAFGAVHREHASVSSEITQRLTSAVGLLLAKEIKYFQLVLQDPPRPFYAVLGGAKVRDKIVVLRNLIDKVDGMLIGGGMSYTFQRARKHKIGTSLYDSASRDLSSNIIKDAEGEGVDLLLPVDYVTVRSFNEPNPEIRTVDFPEPGIPDDWEGVDIGPKTRELFTERLNKAKCILWNGPMGVFEHPLFGDGTKAMAQKISELTSSGTTTILGGGDTGAAAQKYGITEFSHISTGGGASLEFLGGFDLPGIIALPNG